MPEEAQSPESQSPEPQCSESQCSDSQCSDSQCSGSHTAESMPEPTLSFLAGNLYLQSMIALGLLPMPGADKPEVHLDQAKHTIDLIEMLREKTEGNRTEQENKEFEQILHDSRMAYVNIQQEAAAPPAEEE